MAILNGRPINKQLVPHIIVLDVDTAVGFYRRAFEAVEIFRTLRPDGSGSRHHAHLRIGESVIAVTRENPERKGPYVRSPKTVGGLNGLIELFVDDVDAWAARAQREGAEIFRPPDDLFFGDRYCQIVDPDGYLWAFSTPKEMLTAEQCVDRMNRFYEGMGVTVIPTPPEKDAGLIRRPQPDVLSEIHTVTLAVADLARSQAFYRHALGFELCESGDVPATDLAQAWRIPPGLAGRYAVLAPAGAKAGLLRLVSWSRAGVRIWGDYDNYPDLGLFAINFRVRDVAETWRRLLGNGATVKAPITRYRLGDMDVLDGQCFDPDGVVVDVHQISGDVSGLEEEHEADCTPVASVAIHGGPVDAAKAFYERLGFDVLYDKQLDDLGPFLGFPEGLVLRNANLIKRGRTPHGRIELSDYVGKPARSRTHLAVPPNLGLAMLSFESDDFDADHRMLERIGARPAAAVTARFAAVERRSVSFFGPAGEALEIFEDSTA